MVAQPVNGWVRPDELRDRLPWNAPRIGVLEISGAIGAQVRGPEMVRAIKALADDTRIRAVVVEVDSPGGSAPVSDAIHRSLRKLSRRKPTVAFVMTSGLSGGYLIACAASKIVALPTSLIGSIGVIFMRPVVQELMEKIGVRMVMTHEGHLKGMFQPWREPTEEELKKTEALTDQYYNWFVDAVARARGLDHDTVKGYATGEVFTALDAKQMGLVDELGDLEMALDMASEMGRTPRRLQYVRPRRPLIERLMARSGGSFADAVVARIEDRLFPHIDFR
ncbi:MAG: signal peptide peptidase SppA [Chloroflexi bacterium]|nr:MAG: signal peptide peptidase SppA [Chloroflexota bacterium]